MTTAIDLVVDARTAADVYASLRETDDGAAAAGRVRSIRFVFGPGFPAPAAADFRWTAGRFPRLAEVSAGDEDGDDPRFLPGRDSHRRRLWRDGPLRLLRGPASTVAPFRLRPVGGDHRPFDWLARCLVAVAEADNGSVLPPPPSSGRSRSSTAQC